MKSSIDLLSRWQESTYQLPLLENPAAFYQEKERIAAILVDNHLGKLARKVRMLGETNGLDSVSFLDDWAEIAFFTSLWTAFEKLSNGLKLNLIYQSGPNITKKHLSKEKPFRDHFLVLGQDYSVEERLLRRSVYFYARDTKSYYLLLDYSFNQRPFDLSYQAGEVYRGEAVRYPFPGSLRISPVQWKKEGIETVHIDEMKAHTMSTLLGSFSTALKINPFCEPYPAMLELSTHYREQEWIITDAEQHKVKINIINKDRTATFYAASCHQTILVFALCTREGMLPLSYFNGESLVAMGQKFEEMTE